MRKGEWLETNGIGGFASSTTNGCNTRRYHGLLVAATLPPVGRMVLLSKLEEVLIVDGRRYELSVNQFPGTLHPRGDRYLRDFRLDPFPVFVYQVEGLELEKRVFLVHGENTVVVEYELRAVDHDPLPACSLELKPLIAFRDYHSTTHRNDVIQSQVWAKPGLLRLAPYPGVPEMFVAHDADSAEATGDWYLNFEYEEERARGLDFQEDLFQPFLLRYDLTRRTRATVIAGTAARNADEAPELREREILRREEVVRRAPRRASPLVRQLFTAADAFLVPGSIIAGYPWFTDWGRDTMIALPGLTISTGRYEEARAILARFAQAVDRGMLPNRFLDATGDPEFNTVDATLWFFEAVRAYFDATGDVAFVRNQIYPVLKEILNWHLRGTRYGIRVDRDGLLRCGEDGVQLTWMDAKIGDWVVTPRQGKPVEIQALWYNALRITEDLAGRWNDPTVELFVREMALLAKASFQKLFWNAEGAYLFDVVDGEERDASLRPNQIFAVSLRYPLLERDHARRVVAVVERELLTPMGLRSLASSDPRYRGTYGGGPVERDSAYHQGTVWPWLMGPFLSAYLRVNRGSQAARLQAAAWLEGFAPHLDEGCLGQVAEVADGDAPHHPGGCIAQAWSVAELLRVAMEMRADEETSAVNFCHVGVEV